MNKNIIAIISIGNEKSGEIQFATKTFNVISFAQAEEQFLQLKSLMLKDFPDGIIELRQLFVC